MNMKCANGRFSEKHRMMNFPDSAPQQSPLLCSLNSVRTAVIAVILDTPGYIFHSPLWCDC